MFIICNNVYRRKCVIIFGNYILKSNKFKMVMNLIYEYLIYV